MRPLCLPPEHLAPDPSPTPLGVHASVEVDAQQRRGGQKCEVTERTSFAIDVETDQGVASRIFVGTAGQRLDEVVLVVALAR